MVTFKGGSIKSTSTSDVKIYSLSGQQNPAAWLGKKKLKSLRKDKDYQKRVELVQDLRFETATSKIKATPDGEFLIASGIYPPQVKVFELNQYSLKFERHLISEIVDFQVLADDYSKIAFLCADRSVCLHAKYGSHYSLRIPRMGRDIAYDCWSCDLLCAASSPDVYRINLEQGRFLPSLNTQSPGINVVSRSTVHGLVACGGDDGAVECFDMRKKSSVGRTNAVIATGDVDQEITALQFEEVNGYLMAVGNSAGKISIYDLRMSDPIRVKDHMYGSAISSIKWHQTLNSAEPKLISADSHIVRIWDPNTGDNMTSIEPTGNINDICVFPESGLMFLAMDGSQIPAYFVPALGPAPKWCTHLENLTEEMEEKSESTIYDHYKFLTREDLERLNLTSAIGTNLLRAYMHGFFVDYRLYKKAQSILNPFAYDEYLKKRKEEKMEAERASRITIKAKLPKVNRQLAARLLENEEAEEEETNADDIAIKKKSSKKNKGLSSTILKDERFKDLFENKEYELDEFSAEYRQLHPLATKKKPSPLEEHFEPVTEDGEQNTDESDSEPQQSDSTRPRNSKRPRLYEIKDERHADAFWSGVSLGDEDALPLGERVSAMEEKRAARTRTTNVVKMGPGGSREISFIPRGSGRRKNEEPWEGGSGRRKNEEPWEGKRRGVQSLGLKPDKAEFYSSGRGGRGRGRGRGGRGGRGGRSRGRGQH